MVCGRLRTDSCLPFQTRKHSPTTRTVQDYLGQGSASRHILLRPQDRTHTLEDPQPKALTVVSLTYPVTWGDLSPPRFPPVVRVLVHPLPVHINTFLAPSGAGPRGFCPQQTPQPPWGGSPPTYAIDLQFHLSPPSFCIGWTS